MGFILLYLKINAKNKILSENVSKSLLFIKLINRKNFIVTKFFPFCYIFINYIENTALIFVRFSLQNLHFFSAIYHI